MTFAGWGGFNRRTDARAADNRTVARWSGNTSTPGTTPNRIGGAVPSMLQPTTADQPLIKTLTGGVKALEFDGTSQDLLLAPSGAVALVSPRLYWAFHIRQSDPVPLLRTVWAEWGTTERFQIALDATSVIVTVALSAVTTASVSFPLSVAARQAGLFLEVFYDGNALDPNKRIRLYVNQVEVTASAFAGTLPTTLLLGNAVSNWLGSLNGLSNILMQVAHFWIVQGHPTTGERAALALDEAPNWTFGPGDLSVANGGPVSAWMRVSLATLVSGDVSSLPDSLNANPAVQTVAGRRPTLENSANALPCMRFATNDVLSWPVIAATSGVSTWGIGFWVKCESLTGGAQMLYAAMLTTGGASANRLRLYQSTTSFVCEVYASGSVGRFGNTGGVVQGWQFVTLEYDAAAATEALKLTITLAGVVKTLGFGNQGAGAAIGALVAATGNHLLGDNQDGAAAIPLNGVLGPNVYAFGAKMAGATQGLLTQQARYDLMNYERPTFGPADLSAAHGGPLSAWLQVSGATLVSGDVSSLPDALNSNPAVQTVGARRPAKATSGNGLPIMTFDGGDSLLWPLIAANNNVNQIGFAFWFKPGSTVGATVIGIISNGANTATAHKLQFQTGLGVGLSAWFTNANARAGSSTAFFVAGTWYFLTCEYDSGGASESVRQVVTVNGVVKTMTFVSTGAGGSGALQAVTGNAIIGAQGQGAGSELPLPSGSAIGPHIYAFNSKMVGATQGLLTAQARADLMAYQQPT